MKKFVKVLLAIVLIFSMSWSFVGTSAEAAKEKVYPIYSFEGNNGGYSKKLTNGLTVKIVQQDEWLAVPVILKGKKEVWRHKRYTWYIWIYPIYSDI